MENTKKRAYTKRRLVKELAFRSGISQNQARAALEAIIEIAYREARENYFILPGLCKFDVVRRQARNVRNPITGVALVLPERDVLHVVLSKRAKETVVPRVAPMKAEDYAALMAAKASAEPPAEEPSAVASPAEAPSAAESRAEAPSVVEPAAEEIPVGETETGNPPAEESSEAETPAENVSAEEAASDETPATTSAEGEISFFCSTCGQEIIAPGGSAGCEAECPTCGALLTVPSKSVQGSVYAAQGEESGKEKEIISSEEVEDLNPQVLKNRTIRIDAMLLSDLEGETAPNTDESPMASAMKSRTMRIDLPDEF